MLFNIGITVHGEKQPYSRFVARIPVVGDTLAILGGGPKDELHVIGVELFAFHESDHSPVAYVAHVTCKKVL